MLRRDLGHSSVLGLPLNDGVTGHADADPPNGNPETFLDLGDVILSLDRKVFEFPAVANGLIPAGHRDVLHLHPFESLEEEIKSVS